MKTQNEVQLIGYLGIDPIISKLANGITKARLRLATDRYRMDNAGNMQHKVTWHDVVVWGKLAETIENVFIKGSHVLVKGPMIHRTYADTSGHTRYITEVEAALLMNLDR
ncbi:MAG: single-stranded DNA-binding protein [Bacteroidota bacterium]